MAKVINLRQARKQRARDDARATADANVAKHGISKAQRETMRLAKVREDRHLDGHQREPGDEQPG